MKVLLLTFMQTNARCPHQTILITQSKKVENYEALNLIVKHSVISENAKQISGIWVGHHRSSHSLPACAILHVYLAGNLSVSPPIGFCPINSSHAPPFKRYIDTAAPALPPFPKQ